MNECEYTQSESGSELILFRSFFLVAMTTYRIEYYRLDLNVDAMHSMK